MVAGLGDVARPGFQAVVDATDARSALLAYAALSSSIIARLADLNEALRRAAGADPGMAELWATSERERLEGARRVIEVVAGKGPLRPGLDAGVAAEILWTITAPETFQRLVRDRRWTQARYQEHHAATMIRLLLPDGAS